MNVEKYTAIGVFTYAQNMAYWLANQACEEHKEVAELCDEIAKGLGTLVRFLREETD